MANKCIAVVDDEQDILDLVCLHLKKERFDVKAFLDGASFLKYLDAETPYLVVLDLMLPDMDGVEVCKYLKRSPRSGDIPIIMLTARTEETDRIIGLELGADDYVVKPFSPRELMARVKAVLRRKSPRPVESDAIQVVGPLKIDAHSYEVFVEDKKVQLTTTEFRILQVLASRKGWVFSRESILNRLWGDEKIVVDRTIDVHIKHLREKLGKAAPLIKNLRGVGYKLDEAGD